MKRSEINYLIENAIDFFNSNHFYLPPFAFWKSEDWNTRGMEYEEVWENCLGWDVTTFGEDDFHKTGNICH